MMATPSKIIGGEKLKHVSVEADIPLTTLWRWTRSGKIPGNAAVRQLRLKQISDAVERVKAGRPSSKHKRAA